MNVQLREGKTHVQKETDDFIDMSIRYTRRVSDVPLLLRMYAGNDAADKVNLCLDQNADFLIKRNPQQEKTKDWLGLAQREGRCVEPRPDKSVYLGTMMVQPVRFIKSVRLVNQVIESTAGRDGQLLMFPTIELSLFWTILQCSLEQVVSLYKDQVTSEQFLKSELDLVLLPSEKLTTNDLVLHMGLFAYNSQIALTACVEKKVSVSG